MNTYDFREAVEYALRSHDGEHLINGVKQAVYNELRELNPSASIENTPYYNHSFIPDFVISWNRSGKKSDRQVFLRPSMLSATVGQDVEALGHNAPVLMALRGSAPIVEESAARTVAKAPDALLTDVNAIADITFATESKSRNPLHSLVRTNLITGGRGLILSEQANQVNRAIEQSGNSIEQLREFRRLVDSLFSREAAERLGRAASLLEAGVTGQLARLPEVGDDTDADELDKFSGAEAGALLPYLLGRDGMTQDPSYWAFLGSTLTLSSLESMADDLVGVDLTPLVSANLANWQATRASAARVDTRSRTTYININRWHIDNKMLSIIINGWRIYVTANARRLRAQKRAEPALWDDVSEQLRNFTLSSVVLSGSQRRVHVSSESHSDVYIDAQAIRQTVDDVFHVPEATIQLSADNSTAEIMINFPALLATADRPVPAADLLNIVRKLFVNADD